MEGGVTPFSSNMSPSGSYILIVVNQPLSEEHKQIILKRLDQGLLSWDVNATGCDLTGLQYAFDSILKERVTDSDVLIQHSTESLGVEVLLSPTVRTLNQCVKNLLSTPTSHKQLIHAGYSFAGTGSWILENGTFSFSEFLEIFKEANVQNHKRCTVNVHCSEEGDWSTTNFEKEVFTKAADVSLNPPAKVNHVPGSEHLIACLNNALVPHSLEDVMKPSPLVGNIRFNRPTIYMFPAGQGDCALFGINGFNMLIDGGFHRKPCSWEFVRHLDRLDAVLVTRIGESNICGISTLMKRNALNNANPQIGYVFCNIAENKSSLKDGHTENKDDLIVSVVGEGHSFVQTLNDLNLKPHQCWRDSAIDPFVLYHKVGQGTLEMHVLSPPRDSKEMKMFLTEWNAYKDKFSGVKSELKGSQKLIPLSHATSICAILVWRPEDPKDTITRILFPGSAPQNKILEGLDKLKALNILNQPVVTKASLANVVPTKIISTKVEKSISRASIPNRNHTASPALSLSSVGSRNGDIGGLKKDVKEVKKIIKEVKKDVKKEIKKDIIKDTKKEVKTENSIKRDSLVKKEAAKEVKKEVKKIVKKDTKEVKASVDKKPEVKSSPKKEVSSVKAVSEVKKTAVRKSTTPVKKDIGKPPIAPKANDVKKTGLKVSEPKTGELAVKKEVTTKKAADAKTTAKPKPKTAAAAKTSTPKTKPVAVPKPGSKMTKAVAASSIVASAVAVTAAAFELNEKKEDIKDVEPEPEILEKEVENKTDLNEAAVIEKSVDEVVSPLPPEALSPTPSESVSLTPSDTLSSAPLETVSPTPPLPNEPISAEEKDVNEIKDIEQDILDDQGTTADEMELPNLERDVPEDVVIDNEAELEKLQAATNAMSMSFVGEQQVNDVEPAELNYEMESKEHQSNDIDIETKFAETGVEDFGENNIVDEKVLEASAEEFGNKTIEEKDTNEEKDVADEKEVFENYAYEKEVTEEKYVSEEYANEKDTSEDKEEDDKDIIVADAEDEYLEDKKHPVESLHAVHDNADENVTEDSEDKYTYEKNIKDIDNQLAGLSMEGSFCAGMLSSDNDNIAEDAEKAQFESKSYDEKHFEENIISEPSYERQTVAENQSYVESHIAESSTSDNEVIHEAQNPEKDYAVDEIKEADSTEDQMHEISSQHSYEENFNQNTCAYQSGSGSHKEDMHYDESNIEAPSEQINDYSGELQFDKLSNIHSMEESFHQDIYDTYDQSPNIDDPEMQETSVDEPEEIIRKESVMSITLNDEDSDQQQVENWRRKSGTESEDDVDIGKYMSKEQTTEEDRLHVQQGTDSDEEDVVKSPTPHAVVDYDGQQNEEAANLYDDNVEHVPNEIIQTEKEHFSTEKQDTDEKDRDSAEEQDTDDGEMIRHPTPPDMKHSEELKSTAEQHFAASPFSASRIPDITDQPLYEEAEDSGSERSASPIVETPVFGSTAEADFPELVTVSGGTTPSEPQSPKSSFDAKKCSAESAVMDALSEHDVSESSTHSPSCQEGSTVFDLQASETSAIDVQSLQDDPIENVSYEKEQATHLESSSEPEAVITTDDLIRKETAVHDEDKKEDQQETPTDEEDTSSEDENSESHSKDKSDAMEDKSDMDRDDRSDIHNDDKSDYHNDGKSDIVNDNDDDDKSDIPENEQLYRQDNGAFHDSTHIPQENIKSEFSEGFETHYDNENYGYSDDKCADDMSKEYEHSPITYEQDPVLADDAKDLQSDKLNEFGTESAFSHSTDVSSNVNETVSSGDYQLGMNFNEGNIAAEHSDEKFDKPNLEETAYSTETFQSNISAAAYEAYAHNEQTELNQEVTDFNSNDQDSFINKDEEGSSDAFRASEVPFENSEQLANIHGFDTYDHPNEEKTTELEANSEVLKPDDFGALQDVPTGFKNVNECAGTFEQHEFSDEKPIDAPGENVHKYTDLYDALENQFASQPTDAHELDSGAEHQEMAHHYDETYTDNTIEKNLASEADVENYGYDYSQTKQFDTSSAFAHSDEVTDGNIHDESEFHREDLHISDVLDQENKTFTDFKTFMDESENTITREAFEHEQISYPHSDVPVQFSETETVSSEFHSKTKETVSVHCDQGDIEVISESGFTSGVADIDFNDNSHTATLTTERIDHVSVNGKDEASYEISTSEIQSDAYTAAQFQNEGFISGANVTEDSNYLINNRFHSDSPEDNTMRSDSSPDVPYPADLAEKFPDSQNMFSVESSETYTHSANDYTNNMNFSSTDALPVSPKLHSLISNENNTYSESSEVEGNTTHDVLGNVSSYAYTNKAYTREEGDIDGNHIYSEGNTEVIDQVEFDGNNLQALNSNQVSSVGGYPQEFQDTHYTSGANYDFHLEEWGKPMGLPTPPDSSQKTVTKKTDKPAFKSKVDTNGKVPSVSSKLSSPLKKPKPKTAKESSSSPVYVDLAYVPQHADPHYCDVEFFKKIRARYYVFSSVNPSKEVLNALLEAKKTWNEDLNVTIIPTYETDTLGYWMAQNRDDLTEYSIDVSPSASRCTVNLQDHQTSCSAYRLEF